MTKRNSSAIGHRGDSGLRRNNGNTNVIFVERSNDRPCQPWHTPDVDEPRPWLCLWSESILQNMENMYSLWKTFCKDPFRWQIVKSTLWFTLALTLFSEMRSDMNPA